MQHLSARLATGTTCNTLVSWHRNKQKFRQDLSATNQFTMANYTRWWTRVSPPIDVVFSSDDAPADRHKDASPRAFPVHSVKQMIQPISGELKTECAGTLDAAAAPAWDQWQEARVQAICRLRELRLASRSRTSRVTT